MKINRDRLISEVCDFAIAGSGMIVGKPGIGKSYILRQVQKRLLESEILCFVIKVDSAFDESDKAIESELGFDSNWIVKLNKVKLKNEVKAVLIFDAFDAARDEKKRQGFLSQIRKAKVQLKDKWNIIVSVRTYDAQKSSELKSIFSQFDNLVRQFEIGELTEDEINQTLSAHFALQAYYSQSSKKLQEILRVPFFLKLLELIVHDLKNSQIDEIKDFQSEVQLLNHYWNSKIVNTDDHITKEMLLHNITLLMLENNVLSIVKEMALMPIDDIKLRAFSNLRSENILDEVSFNNSRLAYSHNIFFDYALNWFLLKDNYEDFLSFISRDTSRPFFFRPSFIYFFTSLWYSNRVLFWDFFQKFSANENKVIQLFVRLVINTTIASEFRFVDDLSPLLKKTIGGKYAILKLLQSIRFIRIQTQPQDIELLSILSERLKEDYLFEFAFLLERAIKNVDTEKLHICGFAARNFLSYILKTRTDKNNEFLDRLGAYRGIELVAMTYSTSPKKSSVILEEILSMVIQPSFNISYIMNLTEHIKYILPVDPDFVATVYRKVFEHTETSAEETRMGNSVLLSLRSNRRQDYEMCNYRLQLFFPEFLKKDPDLAISTGLKIVNDSVINEKNLVNKEGITFNFRDHEYYFLQDYSSMWGDNRSDNAKEIADHIIQFIQELLTSSEKNFQYIRYIDLWLANSHVGWLWKCFVNLISSNVDKLFLHYFELLINPVLLQSSETSFEVRKVIENSHKLLTESMIKKIEEVTFKTFSADREHSILAMLSVLPVDKLQLESSKDFLNDKKTIANEPPFKSTITVSNYSTEDWLTEHGVDLDNNENRELLQIIEKCDEFSGEYLNSIPLYKNYRHLITVCGSAFKKVNSGLNINQQLYFSVLNSITRTASLMTRDLSEAQKNEFEIIKQILLFSFETSKFDPKIPNISPSSGYGPTPKIEAAEGLIDLFLYDNNDEIFDRVKRGANSQDGVVRYNSIKNLKKLFKDHHSKYWSVICGRLENETDPFNYSFLLSLIIFRNDNLTEEANKVIKIINSRDILFLKQSDFLKTYAEFLLWFLDKPDVTVAFDTLRNSVEYPNFCNSVIFTLFKQVQASLAIIGVGENEKLLQRALQIIDSFVTFAETNIKSTSEISLNDVDLSNKSFIGIIDEIILRIFFTLDHRNDRSLPVNSKWDETLVSFYWMIKPIYEKIIAISEKVSADGLIIAHTAHYFIQSLNVLLHVDPAGILKMSSQVTKLTLQTGYTFDSAAMNEIIKLTEKLMVDHRYLLREKDHFDNLILILDIYINSGWPSALELLWKMDEIFK